MHNTQTKREALQLHKKNIPYAQISNRLGVAKSTLSLWFGAPSLTPKGREKQLAHLARVRPLGLATIRAKKQKWIAEARRAGEIEIKHLPLSSRALRKALLAMLYWAEGTKAGRVSGVRFVNTDPELLSLYLSLLRQAYVIDESRLRARIHIHHYHRPAQVRTFWSNLLSIPESQFGKIYVKKRSRQKRFRKNFMGICFVGYYDSKIREELLALGRGIREALPKQCSIP